MFEELGVYQYHQYQRERFRAGELREEWYMKYPSIFDAHDVKIARNQPDYHFFEWLGAIILYQTLGFYSLVEQYEFKAHKRKREVLRETLPEDVFNLVTNHKRSFAGTQSPDLFAYSPDYSKWLFCEVKGPGDRMTNIQMKYFEALSEAARKPILVIRFNPPKSQFDMGNPG